MAASNGKAYWRDQRELYADYAEQKATYFASKAHEIRKCPGCAEDEAKRLDALAAAWRDLVRVEMKRQDQFLGFTGADALHARKWAAALDGKFSKATISKVLDFARYHSRLG